MPSLMEELPGRIKRLEQKFGSDTPFVKDLKRQLASLKANQDKTTEQVYMMQAREFPKKLDEAAISASVEQAKQELREWVENGAREEAEQGLREQARSGSGIGLIRKGLKH